MYENKKDEIIGFYQQYIPNFGGIEIYEEEKKNPKHSDIAPDLFVTHYTRNCKLDRMPTIISEEDAIKEKASGKSVIKFPRNIPDDPEAFKFPMDGEGQNHYICYNKKIQTCWS